MQDIERVADLAILKEEEAEGIEIDARVQENHLKHGRGTPKKKETLAEICQSVSKI